jgi:hypothetical protein
MRVMVFVPGDKDSEAGKIPSQELFAKMMKRVRFSGSQRTVIDGPFAESKELIAGYWIWQVKSMEEAVEWLKRAPFDGGVEVTLRPVFESEDFGGEITPELRAQEERLRAEAARQRTS